MSGRRRAHSELEATLSGSIRPQHREKLAATTGMHLQLIMNLAGNRAIALLDTGATGNFLDPRFMEKYGIASRKKSRPYDLGSL